MANADSPFGLRPIRKLGSGYVTGGGNIYNVAVGTAAIMAPGDPVILTGTADTDGIPGVTLATAGATERITGVMISMAQGPTKLDGTGSLTAETPLNTVTLTNQYIVVEDDPNTIYEVQCSAGCAITDIGGTSDLLAGTAVAGKSIWEIDSTAHGVGVTGQVQILRLKPSPNNAIGTNAVVEVKINLPTSGSDLAGV
jgi:hypothetical protein